MFERRRHRRGPAAGIHPALDLEMSFVEQKDVMNLVEEMIITAVKELYPQKRFNKIPFPVLSHKER